MKLWNNQLKTVVLLGSLSVLLIGVGGLLGSGFLYGFTALALLLNFGAYFWSDRLVLRLYQAREVTPEEAPRLHRVVEELARRADIPKPRVCVIPAPYANAFATGRNPQHGVVAVTEGILQVLSERELRGVLAHELAHIKNRDILVSTIAAVLAAAVGYLAHALSFAGLFGGSHSDDEEGSASPLQAILLAVIAPLVATLLQLGVSRSREYLADQTGAAISGDADALASALMKLERSAQVVPAAAEPATASLFIVNPFSGGEQLMRWFSTHPPLAERVERLRAMSLRQQMGLAA